jgi:ubiquinone/menaquinone biosynthesis C-methylase UbiE
MKEERPMSNLSFKVMAIIIKIRSIFRNYEKDLLMSGIGEGSKVLDFGCGTGFYTIPTSKMVGGRGKVYALDIHPLAIETVKNNIQKKSLTNIELILSDNLQTGIPSQSLDTVLLFNVLPMVNEKTILIEELSRTLKPNGVLAVKNGRFLQAGKKITENDLIALIEGNSQLKLLEKHGRLYIFKKIE